MVWNIGRRSTTVSNASTTKANAVRSQRQQPKQPRQGAELLKKRKQNNELRRNAF